MHALTKKSGILVALGLATFALHAEDKSASADFVRFREDAKGAQLQTAIISYRNAQGVVVELIGAIHIGDKAYYDTLNQRFTKCEVLLYEMVGEPLEAVEHGSAELSPNDGKAKPRVKPQAPPEDEAPAEQAARDRMQWLHPLYDTLKNALKLENQMMCIDYTKKNFVHADMTARQFAAMQQKRGEGFLQLWWRSVQAQMAQPEAAPNSPGLIKILEILCRPDSPTELKRLMGRMFDQVEKLMSGMETPDGSVIVTERNKVALGVMQQQIARGRKHLGIFYGAAHLPDMEQRLLAMGFKREKTEWLTAWDLPPEPPPVKPAGVQPK